MSRRSLSLLAALLGTASLASCGGASSSRAARLRADLTELRETELAQSEPARRADEAILAAESAERAGDAIAEAEHASRARAWARTAVDEVEASGLERRLGELDAELLEVESQASALEHAAFDRRRASEQLAAARASREEVLRALARAEADESTPRRSRRVGLSDGAEVSRMAEVLAERARVLLAAAGAMGARDEAASPAREALAALGSIAEPLARLAAADHAHGLARAALADARHHAGATPDATEIATLREALVSEGFTPFRDERGLGAQLTGVFEGTAIAPAMRGRLRRLGELFASHPAGPLVLLVETSSDRGQQTQAVRQLEALRRAVLGEREREVVVATLVEVRVPGSGPPATPDGARVLLPAYVERGPEPATAEAASTPSATSPTGGAEGSAGE